MTPGHYEIRLDGLVCHTCVKVLVEEIASLKEVEKASADFEQETLFVTVGAEKTLKISHLKKAFARASKRLDLGATLDFTAIRYKVK